VNLDLPPQSERLPRSPKSTRENQSAATGCAVSLSTKGAVADLPLQHTSKKHDYRRVQGNKHNMEKFELELRSTLFASWCAANLIRLNLKKLIYVEVSGDNVPSDYARWAHIGDLLLNPEVAEDRQCSRLYALWEIADLFCDLVNNTWSGVLDEVKNESPKAGRDAAPVIDLAALRNPTRDSSSS
jgi:hypothetical protein